HWDEFAGEDLIGARLLREHAHLDEGLLHQLDGFRIEMPVAREGADLEIVNAIENRGIEMHHFRRDLDALRLVRADESDACEHAFEIALGDVRALGDEIIAREDESAVIVLRIIADMDEDMGDALLLEREAG